jgi:hypothetical protein
MELASLVINGLMLLGSILGLAKPLVDRLPSAPVEQVAAAPVETAPDPFMPVDRDW